MPELTDSELDNRLAELEREMGPTLRALLAGSATPVKFGGGPDVGFGAVRPARRRLVPFVGRGTSTALAAMLAGGLVLGAVLVGSRPQPVSADALNQLESEAVAVSAVAAGQGCGASPVDASGTTGGVLAVKTGVGTDAGPPASGPASLGNPNALSDQLAAALGLSGDRVRAAMLATIHADMPFPPDPMDGIATRLGLSRDQVCEAFGAGQGQPMAFVLANGTPPAGAPPAVAPGGATLINLNTVTADELTQQAQKLGVSPERLLAAVRASVPSSSPRPPNPDQIIQHFAQNLGLPEDRVRAAISQVEGPKGFYFVVPVPGLGH
jgi:hypothetical protein